MELQQNRIFQLISTFSKNHLKTFVLVALIYIFFLTEFFLNYYFNIPSGLLKSVLISLRHNNTFI